MQLNWCCHSLKESQQQQVCWPPSIALPFLLGPAQQYREAPKLSSMWPHASSETAAAGTPVPQVCQHSSQQTGAGTATGSLEELGYILQSSLLQNWNKSTSLPYRVETSKHPNSKSSLILGWCLLKKIKQVTCHKVRDIAQYSVKSPYLKARTTFVFFL